VVLYTAGRFWIEALRIDKVNEIGGFRLNNYTSVIIFVLALAWFIWLCRHRPGLEEVVDASADPDAADRADVDRADVDRADVDRADAEPADAGEDDPAKGGGSKDSPSRAPDTRPTK
ncbi:MAG: hypothetical protein L0G99_11885, partial [Propionibacteriales bacterium]|nr:hypothetical protein [Propionibacteriales bacterium]